MILEFGLALALIGVAVSLAARLRLSNVPFLILIGMAVGPHAPQIGVFDFRFISSAPLIEFMGRVGILFLLFYLGIESSVSRLIQAGRSIFIGGSIYIALNFSLGGLGGAVWLSVGAAVLSMAGVIVAGQLAGRSAGHSRATSLNVGLTLLGRGEFSIIVAKLAQTGGLAPMIQPFAALYVLILATFAPLLAKESQRIAAFFEKLSSRLARTASTRIRRQRPQRET